MKCLPSFVSICYIVQWFCLGDIWSYFFVVFSLFVGYVYFKNTLLQPDIFMCLLIQYSVSLNCAVQPVYISSFTLSLSSKTKKISQSTVPYTTQAQQSTTAIHYGALFLVFLSVLGCSQLLLFTCQTFLLIVCCHSNQFLKENSLFSVFCCCWMGQTAFANLLQITFHNFHHNFLNQRF